jgi:antitoxin component YwqK of YwqJK toxin-antitoxin module
MIEADLNIAEVPYETGEIRYRYTRYLSPDGARWIRHGLFRAYHRNGGVASEGRYENGVEEGLWRDYYENGVLAAEGRYQQGQEAGEWRYWDNSGRESDKESREANQ